MLLDRHTSSLHCYCQNDRALLASGHHGRAARLTRECCTQRWRRRLQVRNDYQIDGQLLYLHRTGLEVFHDSGKVLFAKPNCG